MSFMSGWAKSTPVECLVSSCLISCCLAWCPKFKESIASSVGPVGTVASILTTDSWAYPAVLKARAQPTVPARHQFGWHSVVVARGS